jgi:hypothetical protein
VKVFISWSGVTSRSVAVALSEWFPKVIQGIKPFVSAKDIDKGANWTVVLAQELADADFGVICLAADNLQSPWLHYEAGAITKSVDSRVCPVLFQVEIGDVNPPMAQLQLTKFDPADIFRLMQSMNGVSGSPLSDPDLQETVDMWWPVLETKLSKIAAPSTIDLEPMPEPDKPEVGSSEMLEEILHRMRSLDSRFLAFESESSGSGFNPPHRIRRKEAQLDSSWRFNTSSELSDIFHMALSQLADVHGLNATKGTITEEGVDIFVANPLPKPLSPEFTATVIRLIGRQDARVRFVGPNYAAVFEKGVVTDALPS